MNMRSRSTKAGIDRRKRARLSTTGSSDQTKPLEEKEHPNSFFCPLTMEVMFDPVLDSDGNTYERQALLEWLKDNSTSPISRQPLNERLIIPNIALREAIHEHMGPEWVAKRAAVESGQVHQAASTASPLRAKVECFLTNVSAQLGGLNLVLNEDGCCAFRYQDVTFVLDVPEKAGMFCFYTRDLIPHHIERKARDQLNERALELNFLQGSTRGGCLSSQVIDNNLSELVFSYTDRIREVSSKDFTNILLNFVETALRIRSHLVMLQVKVDKEASVHPVPLRRSSSTVSTTVR